MICKVHQRMKKTFHSCQYLYYLILLSCSHLSIAQRADSSTTHFAARNAVYLEVGGTAVVYSLNYDRLFSDRKKWKKGARLGIGFLNASLHDSRLVGELYALKPLKNHQDRYFELGIGALYRSPRIVSETSGITDSPAIGLSPRVGIRFQKPGPGWIFRLAFTPVFSKQADSPVKIAPWAGFSIGRSF